MRRGLGFLVVCSMVVWAVVGVRAAAEGGGGGRGVLEEVETLARQWLADGDAGMAEGLSADWTGDGVVNLADFAVLAGRAAGLAPDGEAGGEAAVGEGAGPWEEMAYVPGGAFEMGDGLGDGWADERPVHTVTVDPVRMGRCEVTNGQYCEFLNSALGQGLIVVSGGVVYQAGRGQEYPYCDTSAAGRNSQIDFAAGVFSVRDKGGRSMADDPMVAVSWYGAAAYCNWMSVQYGFEQCYDPATWECDFSKDGYRLPTEAEWEHAARAGTPGQRFGWGDTITHEQANYWSYTGHAYDVSPTRGYHPTWNDGIEPYTSPVGSFAANGFGLHDMAGNVWEWCNDRYSSTAYRSAPADNPTGPTSGPYRVIRGGCWDSGASTCRVSFRYGWSGLWPGARSHSGGFRVVRRPDLSIEFVLIPGWMFAMGDCLGDGDPSELPPHAVTISSFYMGRYEITNQQYCDFLNSALAQGVITVSKGIVYKAGSGTSRRYCDTSTSYWASQIAYSQDSFSVRTKGGRSMANDPMVMVSWFGAVAYCNWMSQQLGRQLCYDSTSLMPVYPLRNGVRLPTEAEWEYAARGGLPGRRFPWGDDIYHTQANYKGDHSYSYDKGPTVGYHPLWYDGIAPYTSPANFFDGSMKHGYQTTSGANGYGLCDMAGNVWEFCNDWYSDSYYSSSPSVNPTGPLTGSSRVIRGGGWTTPAFHCRVSFRYAGEPWRGGGSALGFRVAMASQ